VNSGSVQQTSSQDAPPQVFGSNGKSQIDVDAKVVLIPAAKGVCILRFEEDSADAGDFLHGR